MRQRIPGTLSEALQILQTGQTRVPHTISSEVTGSSPERPNEHVADLTAPPVTLRPSEVLGTFSEVKHRGF